MELRVINILDLIEIMGEDNVKRILSVFDCKKNQEIEDFVRNNAIDFANRKISITYLFVDKDIEKVYAIYAITHKVVEIDPEFSNSLSKTLIKKISRFAEKDIESGKYIVSAFLLAQFGKSLEGEQVGLSGNSMMKTVMENLKKIQHEIGGGIVYLECEDKVKLLDFYRNNHFALFGERFDTVGNVLYKQLLRVI